MRSLIFVTLAIFLFGCSASSPFTSGTWEEWETDKVMLPTGFPFPVKHEIQQMDNRFFWVYDYDLTGDMEPEVRVWYYVPSTRYDQKEGELTLAIARSPYKVEKLKMGYIPILSKTDYQLSGAVEEVKQFKDGKTFILRPIY